MLVCNCLNNFFLLSLFALDQIKVKKIHLSVCVRWWGNRKRGWEDNNCERTEPFLAWALSALHSSPYSYSDTLIQIKHTFICMHTCLHACMHTPPPPPPLPPSPICWIYGDDSEAEDADNVYQLKERKAQPHQAGDGDSGDVEDNDDCRNKQQ